MKIFTNMKAFAVMALISTAPLAAIDKDIKEVHKGPVLMTVQPDIDEGYGVHIEAGFLFEQMYFSNAKAASYLDLSYDAVTPVGPPNVGPTLELISTTFDLTPGIRACVAKYLNHDDWKVSADFEWMYSKGSVKKTGASTDLYRPMLYNEVDDYFNAFKATITTNYYLLDLYLSRGAYLSEKMSITPFVGVKAAWFYIDTVGDFTEGTNTAETIYETQRSRFWGVGPVIGLNSNYTFYHGWSIYNDTNLSILIGNARNRAGLWIDLTPAGTTAPSKTIAFVHNASTICPTIRSSLGLQYETTFNKDAIAAMIKVGFDGRYYFNQFPQVTGQEKLGAIHGESQYGAWGMMGLIVTFGLDF